MATSIRLPIAANLDGTERIEVEGEIVYVKVWTEMMLMRTDADGR
jgi:hypothetical protein